MTYSIIDIATLKSMFGDGLHQVRDTLYLQGVVNSSDKQGNFFNTLCLQDKAENPGHGLCILLTMRDSHSIYPLGSVVLIKLNGLYFQQKNGLATLGGVRTSFGNPVLNAIPAARIGEYVYPPCAEPATLVPREVAAGSLNTTHLQQLIRISGMEAIEEDLGHPMAEPGTATHRKFEDCNGNGLLLANSGFSDFAAHPIPEGNGTVTGVVTAVSEVTIREMADLALSGERCNANYPLMETNSVLISEIADPDNAAGARFIELYNASSGEVSLRNWQLLRYTNNNTSPGNRITIGRVLLGAGEAITFSANPEEYEKVYGFPPGVGVGKTTAADSNGDDNTVLVDPFGNPVDVFGIIGEDGSGTSHEFEDGRALRKPWVVVGNPEFRSEEWVICNDTGGHNTIKEPKQAPGDFTPGQHH